MEDRGLDTVQKNPEETSESHDNAAIFDALHQQASQTDPDLALIVDAWPKPSDAIKTQLVALIRKAKR